ncbi:MAG: LicD family protein [Prevotellaceae bacterium]|jgi:lipopolysaccharide cholinephosphotransferase|nr:LicD family protein [Prevotellaceae bacterium]
MVTYDIRTLQLSVLNTLLALHKVCEEHQLRYYIIAGTLLGAVRHKGFIPWDDDLDIGMPRPDYDKLIANAKEWLPAPYELISGETNKQHLAAFGKIQNADTTLIENPTRVFLGGAYIDVFPLDGVPNGKLAQTLHFASYKFYKKILYFHFRDPYRHGKGIRALPTLISRKLISLEKLHRKLRKILTKYSFDKRSLVADYDDYGRCILNKEKDLGEPTPIIFEGHKVWGIKDYNLYLTKKYGDYMTIPAIENQKQHQFYYLDLTTSYKSITDVNEFLKKIKEEKEHS